MDNIDNGIPLLQSIGYQQMLETLTPGDALLSGELLGPFLHDFAGVDAKKLVVIAYLLGVKQGIHEIECGIDKKHLEDQLHRVYEMGQQHGLHHMAILLGAEPMFTPKFFFGVNIGGSNGNHSFNCRFQQ